MTTEYTPDELSVEIAYVYADEYDTLTYEERRKAFHRWLNGERAKVWDDALNHIQELSDPASSINILPDRELITLGDVDQARVENPYRKDTP